MNEGTNDQQAAEPTGGWQYKSGSEAETLVPPPVVQPQQPPAPEQIVEWSASEFVAHHKGVNWYLSLVFVALAGIGLIYWYTKDVITVGAIAFCAVIFGIAAGRKPRVLGYRLDEAGLTIAHRFYPYNDYKAFAVVDEGRFASISFLPLKRFMPAINIYFDPSDEERIITMLSEHLPIQTGAVNSLDHVMRRIRF